MAGKRIYFASDLHLGLPTHKESLPREKLFIKWLDSIKPDAAELYLLGDIFDFWFEYRQVVPKGYNRFIGKIAEFTDAGIPVYFFSGNHDVWMFNYFQDELGVEVHHKPLIKEILNKKFFLAHGDGLGKGDIGYKLLKSIFTNPALQWLFARLHPNFSLWFGNQWSVSSRYSKELTHEFRGEAELITKFTRAELERHHFDFFIFGHWHSPVIHPLNESSNLVILGDWLVNNTYSVWDGEALKLMRFIDEGEDIVLSVAR
jgi:UDP-2,3-diacylglucosamine hydrolase